MQSSNGRIYNDVSELFFLEIRGYSRLRIFNAYKMWASKKTSIENLANKLAAQEGKKLSASHIKRASRAIAIIGKHLEAPQ